MVTLYEGDYHCEDYDFDELLRRWIDSELPDLHGGGFRPR